jgi:hypothetical protein
VFFFIKAPLCALCTFGCCFLFGLQSFLYFSFVFLLGVFFIHLFIYNLLHKLVVIMTHYSLLNGKIMMKNLLSYMLLLMNIVATLTLGSRPRQRLVRVWAKKEAQESHLMFTGVQKSVRK